MKLHYIATMFVTGAAAAAIAAAPSASATSTVTGPDGGASTATNQRQGHVAIQVAPPTVSDARSYGEFSSPGPLQGNLSRD
ncbi:MULTISPECIES: hypothetical protein [unclassified Mycobacterium]|uniref:hypothetical protein n=1 Tax=unclassified Mycobacterium TaxID=2642494 RepID=UPI000A9B58E4|nr:MULTISPECIES: hypothetical protein [unclassified Mycobacterium]